MNKPRLIDANEYLQKVCTYKETGCGSCKFQECCPKDQPTAYDIDKVVEQLEECSWWTPPTYDEDGYCNDDSINVVDLDDAIEIVEKGGAE